MHRPLLRLLIGVLGVGCGAVPEPGARTEETDTAEEALSSSWHRGAFRHLPWKASADLANFAAARPRGDSYSVPDSTRRAAFRAFVEQTLAAVDASRVNPAAGDWCGVREQASAAGYGVYRLYDRSTGRWFVYAADESGTGGAYVWLNPAAKQDVIVEAPHAGFDEHTERESALVFRSISARVLLQNGADRCASSSASSCDGETAVCGGGSRAYRLSDAAHEHRSLFHVAHMVLDDSLAPNFVQLHTMRNDHQIAIAGNGSTSDADSSTAVSSRFRAALDARTSGTVASCQGTPDPNRPLCGENNIQGRYTNGRDDSFTDACENGTSAANNRFLHVEQVASLADEGCGDDNCWSDVADALKGIWTDCEVNPSACSLGARQAEPDDLPTCACGSACPTLL